MEIQPQEQISILCRILGTTKTADYFAQEMSFAYHENILYFKIGEDIYESKKTVNGMGTAISFQSPGIGNHDAGQELLTDPAISMVEYTLWPAGSVRPDKSTPRREDVDHASRLLDVVTIADQEEHQNDQAAVMVEKMEISENESSTILLRETKSEPDLPEIPKQEPEFLLEKYLHDLDEKWGFL